MTVTSQPEAEYGMKMLNQQEFYTYISYENHYTWYIIDIETNICIDSKAYCIHHAEIGELDGLKIASGEKFTENLEKLVRENSNSGLDLY